MTHSEDFAGFREALCEALHARGGGKPPYLQGKAVCEAQDIRAFFGL
jgi:hypothetical protein